LVVYSMACRWSGPAKTSQHACHTCKKN
jgi:hypothetical protein